MSELEKLHLEFYKSGVLTLPEDESERKEAAHTLIGGTLVSCTDDWIKQAERTLQSHEEFVEFTEEQKTAVLALISNTAYGALYSQCVEIDYSNLEINLIERDEEGRSLRSTPVAGASEYDWHYGYFDWVERFGDYYNPDSVARFKIPWVTNP